MTFRKVDDPNNFFMKVCSFSGTQTIDKVSAASTVKNCHPRTSLISSRDPFLDPIISLILFQHIEMLIRVTNFEFN